jgi:elongation factor P
MNTTTYEQVFFNKEALAGVLEYLLPNSKVQVVFYDDKPIGVEAPRVVDLLVVETDPTLKTATITSTPKPAKLETGLTIMVPQFVEIGDKVRVDTSDGKYLERAK